MTEPWIFPPERVTIVGVLNVTPDSFSDGGRFVRADAPPAVEAAVAEGLRLVAAGAHVLDVGGESTRPGARPVPPAQQLARTLPVVEGLAKSLSVPIAIDTRSAEVAAAVLGAGAALVNDVSGFRHDAALPGVVARAGGAAILGHLRGIPERMQESIAFDDVLREVGCELAESIRRAEQAGIGRDRLVVDPGIGFGKSTRQNLELLANVGSLGRMLGLPVLVGPSRKGFLGELTGDPPRGRDTATHAACAVAVFAGANAVRVHDVAGVRRAVQVAEALRASRSTGL